MQTADISTPPRILVISQLPPPVHGSSMITALLLDTLRAGGFAAKLADRRFSTTIADVGTFTPRKVLAGLTLLGRVWRKSRGADVCIFFVTNRPASFLVDCAIRAVLKTRGLKTIAYVHTMGYSALSQRSAIWSRLAQWLFHDATSVVSLSPTLESDVSPLVSAGTRRTCIANAVDEAPAGSPPAPDGLTFTYLSNLIPEKGIDDFLSIARRAHELAMPARFEAGGAPVHASQLDDLAESSSPNTRILGPVSGPAKDALLAGDRVLVFPSTYEYEAQPLTIIEALAAGVPVIAYEVGGIGDVVRHDVNGLLVRPGDVEGLLQAISRVAEDSTLRARLSEGATATFFESHSRQMFQASWKEELRHALS